MQETRVWSLIWDDAMEQLNLCTTTAESKCPRTCALQQDKPLQQEAHALQLENSPHSLQLEKACAAMNTQCSQKKKKCYF